MVDFKGDRSKDAFKDDRKTPSAVSHQLPVIGQAVKRLSDEFRNAGGRWAMMAGMRAKVIHKYDGVDPDEVWKAAAVDIPALLSAIEPLSPAKED